MVDVYTQFASFDKENTQLHLECFFHKICESSRNESVITSSAPVAEPTVKIPSIYMWEQNVVSSVEKLIVFRPAAAAPDLNGELFRWKTRQGKLSKSAWPNACEFDFLTLGSHFETIVSLQHEVTPKRSKIGVVKVLSPTFEVHFIATYVEVVSWACKLEQLLIQLSENVVSVIIFRI